MRDNRLIRLRLERQNKELKEKIDKFEKVTTKKRQRPLEFDLEPSVEKKRSKRARSR